jgi:branched-chain amino acid transport system ATP-binding protein
LTVDHLSVSYGGVRALVDVSLELPAGGFLGVLGANGAGKSTLLKAISGLVPQSSGTIRLDGHDLLQLPAHRIPATGVAHVPERRRVFPSLSVVDNLRLGGFTNKAKIKNLLEQIYSLFPKLKDRRKQLAGSLSGGEQQMLAVGRALMMEPRLLMLDEPSLGLAPIIVEEMFTRLASIHRELGVSMLLIEQNASEALDVIDRGVVLNKGQVSISGTRDEIVDSEYLRGAYLAT